jgi:hypothetical protein
MDLKQANEANKSGYWQVPNSFMKRIRQLTMNELRSKVFELAGALMDQRNANHVLSEKIKALESQINQPKEEVKSE